MEKRNRKKPLRILVLVLHLLSVERVCALVSTAADMSRAGGGANEISLPWVS
jgi:hypothetical protein